MNMPALKKIHIGRNIERIRELKGIKQEAIAAELGITQQAVSKIEQSEEIDEEKLEKIAKALGLSKEAIRSYSEDTLIFHIEHMHDNASANYQYHFNPLDKVIELYERMLKDKDAMIEILHKNQQKPS
jgi:transcriptional regulator with XRE-family HTH domain